MNPEVFGEILEDQTYHERLSVYGLLYDSNERIAIIKTPRGFFLPGGGLEDGESHTDCIIREFIEETGYVISMGEYIGCGILYGFTPREKSYMKMIGHFYHVSLTGELKAKIEDDHEVVWYNSSEALNIMQLEHQAWAIKTTT